LGKALGRVTDADQRPVLKESYQTQIRFDRNIGAKWPKSILDRPKSPKNLNVFAQITGCSSFDLQIRGAISPVSPARSLLFVAKFNNQEPALNFAQPVIER
jgi:hypothetical protein